MATWFEQQNAAKNRLVHDINQWRRLVLDSGLTLSPWLVFNAMQRCFSLHFPKQLEFRGGNPSSVEPGDVFRSFGIAFFNIWSAFAHLETGSLFGRPDAVSMGQLRWKPVDKEIDYKKTDMYQQNILGLLMANEKHHKPSVTYLLSLHPLCELALSSFRAMAETAKNDVGDLESVCVDATKSEGDKGISWAMADKLLSLSGNLLQGRPSSREWMRTHVLVADAFLDFKGKIEESHIIRALEQSFPEFEDANKLFNDFIAAYNKKSELAPRFEEAIKRVYKRPPEPLDKPAE